MIVLCATLAVSLAISSIIETSSWNVRSLAEQENTGFFIARTNLYLYGGRFFLLIFSGGMAYLVEVNSVTAEIANIIFLSYMLVVVTHALMINKTINEWIKKGCARLLKLPYKFQKKEVVRDQKLLGLVIISAGFFTCAVAAPFLLATKIPDFRMTISTVGQFLNSIGTLILLVFVDPILYKLMDKGRLSTAISSYIQGRMYGFLAGGIIVLVLGSVI